jgi:hypothetical protein
MEDVQVAVQGGRLDDEFPPGEIPSTGTASRSSPVWVDGALSPGQGLLQMRRQGLRDCLEGVADADGCVVGGSMDEHAEAGAAFDQHSDGGGRSSC